MAAHCHEYRAPATLASETVVGLMGSHPGGVPTGDAGRVSPVEAGGGGKVGACSGGGGCAVDATRAVYERNARVLTDCLEWLIVQPPAVLARALRQYDKAAGCANLSDASQLPTRGFVRVTQVPPPPCEHTACHASMQSVIV